MAQAPAQSLGPTMTLDTPSLTWSSAGSTHSAMRINPLRMAALVGAEWVDVCEAPPSF
jgi:hypothetical protein